MTSYARRRLLSLAKPSVDLRPLLSGGVRTQGLRPLCLPFSVSAAHEAARALMVDATPEALAVEPLWQHCVLAGEASQVGTTLSAVVDAAVTTGQTTEAIWPYNATLGAGTEPTPAAAARAPFMTTGLIAVPLAHDGVEEPIELALNAGLPVVLVLELTAEFEQPGTAGEIAMPPLTAPVSDYHAVVAVGAATIADGSVRRLLIRNSWGHGWGAGGYGWLPYDYLVSFAVQASVVEPSSLASR